MPLTFGDAQALSKSKRTRREVFLAAMHPMRARNQWLALVAPFSPEAGRQPDALETL